MFIENFSVIVAPMTKVTQKNMNFLWTEDCERAICELNHNLIIALVLVIPVRDVS